MILSPISGHLTNKDSFDNLTKLEMTNMSETVHNEKKEELEYEIKKTEFYYSYSTGYDTNSLLR